MASTRPIESKDYQHPESMTPSDYYKAESESARERIHSFCVFTCRPGTVAYDCSYVSISYSNLGFMCDKINSTLSARFAVTGIGKCVQYFSDYKVASLEATTLKIWKQQDN